MRIILFSCFALASIATVRAVVCWECDTEPTNEQCIRNGRMKACLSNQNMCQNEVRTTRTGSFEISKRCKQSTACNNNVGQNTQSFQCSSRVPKQICRCCCSTNLCNEPFLECHEDPIEPPPVCRMIGVPRFGRRECTPRGSIDLRRRTAQLGVECRFTCREGFFLYGSSVSVCERSFFGNTARFNRAKPRCGANSCNPPRTAPQNGAVSCTNGNTIRSVCTYTCNPGYARRGSPSTRCGLNNRWSRPPPTCIQIECRPVFRNLERGSVTCTNSNFAFSVCSFTCNQGFLLEGSDRLECADDGNGDVIGQWSAAPPVCLRIRCNPPQENPINGAVDCSNSNEEGSECTFQCNSGFFLSGDEVTVCEDDGDRDDEGVWSRLPPTCVIVTCSPEQTAPENGQVTCSRGNSFGSNCRFTCNNGFFRDGAANTRCVDDNDGDDQGVWTELPPVCLRITCEPMQTNPTNGDVSCSNMNNLGSVCRFACQEGFAVVGASSVTCRDDNDQDDDGVWSAPPPICSPVTCNPPHQDPSNGNVDCTNANSFASVCSFTCNDGYFLDGNPQSICRDDRDGDTDGVWSSAAPTCVRIRCRPRTNPRNGMVSCTDENYLDSVCTFTCNEGYFLNGEMVNVCNDDEDGDALGVWSDSAPICRRVLCIPPHTNPTNGEVSCTNTNNDGSLCTFTCNQNYFLLGSPTSLCEDDLDGDEDGLWNTDAPTCIAVTCNPPRTDPENGEVNCFNGNNAGSLCTYSCSDGYFLDTTNGASSTTCVDDNDGDAFGEWSDEPPSCSRITCVPAHTDPTNGNVDCSDSNFYTSTCSFSCNDGFFLRGSSTSTCGEDDTPGDEFGAWSSPAPTCIRITCRPGHTDPMNGEVTCTNSNFVNSVCTFTCNSGFFLDGSATSTCNDDNDNDADGVWSSVAPTCGRISCVPEFSDLSNGVVMCSDANYVGSTCSFRCNERFFLMGEESSECLDDDGRDAIGRWSNTGPVCARIICNPQQTSPSNGNVMCSNGNREDSVCTFTCDSGYFLSGSATTTCEDDNDGDNEGVWSNLPPTCLRVFCTPPHSDPENGAVDCSDSNNEGSVCSFTCNDGFFLDGSPTSECEDDMDGDQQGVWSSLAPTCVRITCSPAHQDPTNGDVECTDGNFYLSVCTFSCDVGFFLDGSAESQCTDDNDNDADGVWSSVAPVCVQITCEPAHVDPANGEVDCTDGNNLASECTFTCLAGYFLDGSSTSTCTDDNDDDADGVWSSVAPVCGRISCRPELTDPRDGSVMCSDSNFVGSTCSFRCSERFFLMGEESVTCLDDDGMDAIGVWNNQIPVCARIICLPEQSDPNNGNVMCSDRNREDSVCTFTCDSGYFLSGSATTTCEDDNDGDSEGVWSNLPPTCLRVFCTPPHTDPENGAVDCSDSNNEGSVCRFTCNDGFFLNGEAVSSCMDDEDGDQEGMWSSLAPTCVRITCSPPHQNPTNGQVDCSDGNFYLSVCEFVCNVGFFLDGSAESRCTDDNDNDADGVWSSVAPVCVQITCEPAHVDPANGEVDCTDGNNLGSLCSFECGVGFFLNGEQMSQCTDDDDGDAAGVWDRPAPSCEQILCLPGHTDPTNGNVACSNGNLFASVCQFECDDGFFLNGEAESTCTDPDQNDAVGAWSSPAATCSRIICQPAHVDPENGNVECTNANNENSVCTFECNEGFFLIGIMTSTCLDNEDGDRFGLWTSEAPVCSQIRCVPPQANPDNGVVECTNENLAGSVCNFECNEGYFLSGSTDTECIPDVESNSGDWNRSPPTCIQITCRPAYTTFENGRVMCTDDNNVASECEFTCNPGFALIGTSELVCVDDSNGDQFGSWSSPPPQCQRITCEPPYSEIENGVVNCTNANFVNSLCIFTCDTNFAILGETESICVESERDAIEGIWTFPPPTCFRPTCGDPPGPPENGRVTCTDGNFLNSECEYSCDDYHTRIGPLTTTCIEDENGNPVWSNNAPECSPNVCPAQEIENGRVVCNTTTLIAPTRCEFTCNTGFEVYPADLANNMCMNNSQWSTDPPCCARLCPPFAVIDLVVILDASTSVNVLNWDAMKMFAASLTETFSIGSEMTRIGVFRYNEMVDSNSQILLRRSTSLSLMELREEILALPYRDRENGTFTGAALRHARDVFFQANAGDRANAQNVVLLLTDGQAQDDISTISRQLREDGTLVYVIGILPPAGSLNREELNEIAGDPDRVIIAVDGFDSLDEQFAALISNELCPPPCQ